MCKKFDQTNKIRTERICYHSHLAVSQQMPCSVIPLLQTVNYDLYRTVSVKDHHRLNDR